MKPLLMALLATLSFSASLHAAVAESAQSLNETDNSDMGTVNFSISRFGGSFTDRRTTNIEDAKYSGSESGQIFRMGYEKSLDDSWALGFGAQFMSRDLSQDRAVGVGAVGSWEAANRDTSINGLRALNFAVTGNQVYEIATLTYGFDTELSPGPSKVRWEGRDKGNNFLGYNTYAPWVGFESYVGMLQLHARTIWSIYGAQTEDAYGSVAEISGPKNEHSIEAGFEVPAYKRVNVGMTAVTGRSDANVFKMLTGESDSQYGAKVFGSYLMDASTAISMSLGSESRKIPYSTETTEFELGLKRSL